MTQPVHYESADGIAQIRLERPDESNAINPEVFFDLGRAYYKAEHDQPTRVVVLYGAGDDFSIGIDPGAFLFILLNRRFSFDGEGRINPFGTTTRLSKPLVAAVHGEVGAMANELILAADIRIAADNTKFSQGEPSRGSTPAGGASIRLPLEVGWGNAMRWILTGESWSAQEAHRMGLVQEVVPHGEQHGRALELAQTIAKHPPLGIKETLRIGRQAWEAQANATYPSLLPTVNALIGSNDFKERIMANREGREPNYTGT
jgi:enoyl-CoA hydratase